jgi:hypothetical protein
MLSFDKTDMFACGRLEAGAVLESGDVPHRLEDMHRLLEEAQDIGRVDVDPILVEQERCYLPVVKTVLAEFDDLPGELLLGAPAVGGLAARAAEKGGQESEELVTEDMIEAVDIQTGGKGVEGCAMEGKVRYPIAHCPLDLPSVPEPCLFGDQ